MKRMISTNSMESDQSALYKLKSKYHTFLQYVLETILLISSQNVVSVIDSYQNKISSISHVIFIGTQQNTFE